MYASEVGGTRAAETILAGHYKPTAIFAANDQMAFGAGLALNSIFYVLAALGLINVLFALWLLPESHAAKPKVASGGVARNYGKLLTSPAFLGFALGGGCATTSMYAFISVSPFIFAHQLGRPAYEVGIYPAILLDRANELAARDPNSTTALLWQAEAEQASTGVRTADPPEFAMFEAVLARDPNQLEALLGLADGLIQRAARDLSKGANRTDDIRRAAALLERVFGALEGSKRGLGLLQAVGRAQRIHGDA